MVSARSKSSGANGGAAFSSRPGRGFRRQRGLDPLHGADANANVADIGMTHLCHLVAHLFPRLWRQSYRRVVILTLLPCLRHSVARIGVGAKDAGNERSDVDRGGPIG
jgi:hypothetical protein